MKQIINRFLGASLFLLVTAGCASISYDDQADQQLTALSQEINQQLISWKTQVQGTPATPAAYDKAFYDKIEADISTLEIRMEATQSPSTDKLVNIFQSLFGQIEALRSLHSKQGSIKDGEFLEAERELLNVQIASLETFELSLKSSTGSTQSVAKTSSTATSNTSGKASGAGAASIVGRGPSQ